MSLCLHSLTKYNFYRFSTKSPNKTGRDVRKSKGSTSLLRGLVGAVKTSTDCELLHDVLPNPIDSPEQLITMSKAILDDEGFKKRMVIK